MIGAIAIGIAGGIIAGLLGVGGGVLFVPGLVLFMKLGQHQAEATSLLAIVPVAIVGTIRQDRYGNVRRDDAVVTGALSLAGAIAGVALANTLSGEALRVAFAILILFVAAQLVRSTLRSAGDEGARGADDDGAQDASDDGAQDASDDGAQDASDEGARGAGDEGAQGAGDSP